MVFSTRQKLVVIFLLVYWPALFILAHIPIPLLIRRAGVSDKCIHFLAYLILVFLLWFATNPDKKVIWRKAAAWWVFAAMIGYGIADELSQSYVGRTCDVRDFGADVAGVVAGLVVLSLFTFWPASLLVAAVTIFGLTNVSRANLAELLPVTNAAFHLFSYAIFTMLWLQLVNLRLASKPPQLIWLITASALPAGFLLVVKLFSTILGRDFRFLDVILAAGGIVAVVVTIYLTTLFRQRLAGDSQTTAL